MDIANKPLYPMQVTEVTQKSLRCCQLLFAKIRKKLGKSKNYTVTVKDFADYKEVSVEYLIWAMGVDEDLVKKKKL